MDARTAGNDDLNVLRPVGDPDMVRVADFREPARPAVLQSLDAARGKSGERDAGALEHRVLYLFLADAVTRERPGMLRADDEQRTGREDDVVVAEAERGA